MNKFLLNFFAIITPVLMFSGCVSVPIAQTPDEFIKQVSTTTDNVINKKEVINVKYSTARYRLIHKVEPCLSGTIHTTALLVNNVPSGSNAMHWNTKIIDLSKTRTRFVLQMRSDHQIVMGASGNVPKDGFYMGVIDLRKESSNRTLVSYHVANYVAKYAYQSTRDFLAGKSGTCKFK